MINKPFLDDFDQRILEVVMTDGRITTTALAEKVGLSKTPCHVRLNRLVSNGVIRGFRAIVDPGKVGLNHVAFVEVKMRDTREQALEEFGMAVARIRQVEECHLIAGHFDYLLKVRTTNIQSYREVLGEQISCLPHVASTSTFVSMETVK